MYEIIFQYLINDLKFYFTTLLFSPILDIESEVVQYGNFIGVDGGGTKTEATAINSAGEVLSRYTGGSTNPYIVTFNKAMEELRTVLDGLLAPLLISHYYSHQYVLGCQV